MKRVELKYIFSKAGSLFKNLIFKNIFWLIFDQLMEASDLDDLAVRNWRM
jgi:hypothetical protein